MENTYKIISLEKPAWGIIGPGISEYNEEQAGDDQASVLCFALKGPGEEIVGGVIGEVYWDWFYLNLMWIKADLRGRGYGAQLLQQAEAEARNRGATKAYLDTFSFQAPGFYQQFGYQVFGELPEFPAGHQRYFMKKEL